MFSDSVNIRRGQKKRPDNGNCLVTQAAWQYRSVISDGPTTGCPAEGSAGTGGTGGRPADQRAGATADPQNTVDSGTSRWRRTVILIEQRKDPGQDLFIRGGIGPDQRPGNR